jgi:hypothetical protein
VSDWLHGWTILTVIDWSFDGKITTSAPTLLPGKVLPENAADVFPDLQKGALGACALVAVADSMLGKKRG